MNKRQPALAEEPLAKRTAIAATEPFDPSSVPAQLWVEEILPRIDSRVLPLIPQLCTYFRDLLQSDSATALWRSQWRRWSTIDLNPAFESRRWKVLYSLVLGRCFLCGAVSGTLHVAIPANACWRCRQQSSALKCISRTQAQRQFHLTKGQCAAVLEKCRSFSSTGLFGGPTTHYFINEVALRTYSLFGGKDEWLQRWRDGETRRAINGVEQSWLNISDLP
jgi:hypothetical protein